MCVPVGLVKTDKTGFHCVLVYQCQAQSACAIGSLRLGYRLNFVLGLCRAPGCITSSDPQCIGKARSLHLPSPGLALGPVHHVCQALIQPV